MATAIGMATRGYLSGVDAESIAYRGYLGGETQIGNVIDVALIAPALVTIPQLCDGATIMADIDESIARTWDALEERVRASAEVEDTVTAMEATLEEVAIVWAVAEEEGKT